MWRNCLDLYHPPASSRIPISFHMRTRKRYMSLCIMFNMYTHRLNGFTLLQLYTHTYSLWRFRKLTTSSQRQDHIKLMQTLWIDYWELILMRFLLTRWLLIAKWFEFDSLWYQLFGFTLFFSRLNGISTALLLLYCQLKLIEKSSNYNN